MQSLCQGHSYFGQVEGETKHAKLKGLKPFRAAAAYSINKLIQRSALGISGGSVVQESSSNGNIQ